MTEAQAQSLEYVTANAHETGATVEHESESGTLWITLTESAEWDNARSTWTVDADGAMVLL